MKSDASKEQEGGGKGADRSPSSSPALSLLRAGRGFGSV